MTYGETLEYIHGINRYAKKLGLENIRRLMRELGDPQDRLQFVHIAGTNGKGSTAALTASVMRAAGYRTGLYTSPYLQRFTERIRVDGCEIPEPEVVRLTAVVMAAIERIVADGFQHPTELEVVAAIAFLYFEQTGCDVVALEVGLGGRYDPTNVIKAPLAAVINTIDYDHIIKLGGTLEKIAYEKAGIIKPGCDAVVYPQREGVLRVFESEAREVGARLTVCDFSSLRLESFGLDGQRFSYGRYEGLEISLLGDYQANNAALVVEAVDTINRNSCNNRNSSNNSDDLYSSNNSDNRCGIYVPEDALRRGLKAARWPGRLELLCENPAVVVDAAHNAQCAQALRGALLKYFPDRELVLIFGVLRDKDYLSIIDSMLPIASEVFTVTPGSERALSAEELAGVLAERSGARLAGRIHACGSVTEATRRAIERARSTDAVVCAFGSLYYIGAVREIMGYTQPEQI